MSVADGQESSADSSTSHKTPSRESLAQGITPGVDDSAQSVGDAGSSLEDRSGVSGPLRDHLPDTGENAATPLHGNAPESTELEGQRDTAAATKQEHHQDEARSRDCVTDRALVEALHSLSLEPQPQTTKLEDGEPPPEEVGLIYDPIMEQHICQSGHHLECPERTAEMVRCFETLGLHERCLKLRPRLAKDEELRLVHSEAHIKQVENGLDYPDCDIFLSEGSVQAARTAVGCCIEAVEAVLSGRCTSSFAVVRPPGHHAECQRAMGFCLYNNTAIAAVVAQRICQGRVLLLDWDVHHGNGIQEVLYDNADIMYISIHRGGGFYPGTGHVKEVGGAKALGKNLNIPWPRGGFGDADYMTTFDLVVEPVVAEFAPDLIIVSAGYDAADGDYLGGMNLTPAAYAHMTRRLQKLSKSGRMVLALEGGYNVDVTASCAAHCVQALLGDPLPVLQGRQASRTRPETQSVLRSVTAAQAPYWSCLPTDFAEAWEEHALARKLKSTELHSKRSPKTVGRKGRT